MFNRNWFRVGICAAVLAGAALLKAADVPRPAGDLTISMLGNQSLQLGQYKGKVCVLAFILTTCPHCQKTVGYLSGLQNEYGPRGLQVVASAIDDMATMYLPDFLTRFKPPFPVGFNPLSAAQDYLHQSPMYRMLMPQLVFIDRTWTVRAQYAGDDPFFATDQEKHLRDQIEVLLKETPAAHKKRAAAPAKRSS